MHRGEVELRAKESALMQLGLATATNIRRHSSPLVPSRTSGMFVHEAVPNSMETRNGYVASTLGLQIC
jgi:hypothetical protein